MSVTNLVIRRIAWQTSHRHKFGVGMDQELYSIQILKGKQSHQKLQHHSHGKVSASSIYLCWNFKTLELLFVVNSGVVCRVVKMNVFSVTA